MKGFFQDGNTLLWERNYEKIRIELWGLTVYAYAH